MTELLTKEERILLEKEIRRGTSKSRIAALLSCDYDTAVRKIERFKSAIRPVVGEVVVFRFRESQMSGKIIKLLANSAVVDICWDSSDLRMKDICRNRTIVNYMDFL